VTDLLCLRQIFRSEVRRRRHKGDVCEGLSLPAEVNLGLLGFLPCGSRLVYFAAGVSLVFVIVYIYEYLDFR
jgi:hypothetical protein